MPLAWSKGHSITLTLPTGEVERDSLQFAGGLFPVLVMRSCGPHSNIYLSNAVHACSVTASKARADKRGWNLTSW